MQVGLVAEPDGSIHSMEASRQVIFDLLTQLFASRQQRFCHSSSQSALFASCEFGQKRPNETISTQKASLSRSRQWSPKYIREEVIRIDLHIDMHSVTSYVRKVRRAFLTRSHNIANITLALGLTLQLDRMRGKATQRL